MDESYIDVDVSLSDVLPASYWPSEELVAEIRNACMAIPAEYLDAVVRVPMKVTKWKPPIETPPKGEGWRAQRRRRRHRRRLMRAIERGYLPGCRLHFAFEAVMPGAIESHEITGTITV